METKNKILIELEEWQVRTLKSYFGQNDKTQVAHWAFFVFDEALKLQSTSQQQTIERLYHFVQTFKEAVDDGSIILPSEEDCDFGKTFYEASKKILFDLEEGQLLNTTEPIDPK